jgi:hypothetical protein
VAIGWVSPVSKLVPDPGSPASSGPAATGSAGAGSDDGGSTGAGSGDGGSAGIGSARIGSAGIGSAGIGSAGIGSAGIGSAARQAMPGWLRRCTLRRFPAAARCVSSGPAGARWATGATTPATIPDGPSAETAWPSEPRKGCGGCCTARSR